MMNLEENGVLEIDNNQSLTILRRQRRKRWIWTLAAIVLLCGIGIFIYFEKAPKPVEAPPNETAKVEQGDVTDTLNIAGVVQATKEVNMNFTSAGTSKLTKVNVVAGDSVKAGQILAQLDDSEAKIQIKSAESSLEIAKVKLNEVKKGAKPSELETQKENVLKAKMTLDSVNDPFALKEAENQKAAAKANLDKAMQAVSEPDGNTALKEAEQQIATAKSNLDKSQKEYDDQSYLYGLGAISLNEATEAERNLEKAKNEYTNAELQYTKAKTALQDAQDKAQKEFDNAELQYEKTVTKGKQAEEEAKFSYESALKGLKAAEAPPEVSAVMSAESAVQQAAADLKQKEGELSKLQITAPWDGLILKVNGDVGTSPTAPFIVMNNSNSNQLKVLAKVDEIDIAKMKMGLKAIMRTDSYSGKEYEGKITFVSPQAVTDAGMTTYTVELSIQDPEGTLKTGMNMQISVELATHNNVLYIPLTALQSEGGQDGVYLVSDPAHPEIYKFQPVEVGIYTSDRVEIKSGVAKGGTIVIPAEPPMENPNYGAPGF
ncbi:efflux RND transporter periplasmic adaptor subunit [Paenibacillus sp.]|jgi:HlyD family secretion protein|uniref:efflux RND transporter periplasmic adaptor subunit n=1 Tax=Paenibacillus sp. TaxID=58172 RepID=UPI002819E029|nr:efflux RND transporter periplasmic adaptor subunit [Paenibacillus sp.]MDR0268611.1 efflux RND transporter periplasmic adaptor subunit [Paenibacillus sp.]